MFGNKYNIYLEICSGVNTTGDMFESNYNIYLEICSGVNTIYT